MTIKIHTYGKLEQHGIENPMLMVKDEIEDWTTIRNAGGTIEQYGVYELVKPNWDKPCFAVQIKGKTLAYLKQLENPNQHLKLRKHLRLLRKRTRK